MAGSSEHRRFGEYTLRQYEPDDRAAVLSLYEDVFGRSDEAWFDWRYVDNPYLSGTQIAVAEHDGEVVAARPAIPIPLTVGDESVVGVIHPDPMVRPAHRGQGVFTELVWYCYDHYASREPEVFLGFGSEVPSRALVTLDEERSYSDGLDAPFPTDYRVRWPGRLAARATDRHSLRALGWLSTPLARASLAVKRREMRRDAPDVTVRRRDAVPVAVLSKLAKRTATGRVRATRDERFYGWRFANPRFEYTTYVARRESEPLSAVVVGRAHDDDTTVRLSDVVPVEPAGDETSLASVLRAAFEDNRDAEAVVTAGPAIPPKLRAAAGFVPKTRWPLSWLSSPTRVVARPLTHESSTEWRYGDLDLIDPDSWSLSMCERELG